MTFNARNRSIYGVPQEIGVFRIDVKYTDDSGKIAFINTKVTVIPRPETYAKKELILIGLSISFFFGFLIYQVYMIQFCKELAKHEGLSKQKLKENIVFTRLEL